MFRRNHQAVSLNGPGIFVGFVNVLRFVLILSLVVFTSLWGYLKISDPATLPITKVRALGDFTYVTEEMLHLALAKGVENKNELSVLENKGFFDIDVDAIKKRVEEMPWVKQVSVQRVWPDTLVIEVVEHTPIAYWGNSGLVSNTGEVFRPLKKTYPKDLPRFLVTKGHDGSVTEKAAIKSLRYFSDASDMFSTINLKVKKVKFDARQALTLSLDNGVELNLGRQNKLYRLQRFVQIYAPLRERMSLIERVDMRYTNGFSVKWKQLQGIKSIQYGEKYLKEKSGKADV